MTSPESKETAQPDNAPDASRTPLAVDVASAASKLTSTDGELKTMVEIGGEIALADAPIAAGEKVGKYEIRSQLGTGGMGAVYLAFDPLIEREVALKVLSPNLGDSPIALQRFLGEARAIGRLNHPNVVSIYDIDLWSGKYFLVMELLSGGSVSGRVQSTGKLPWQEACRITAEAARGLGAAHAADLIHRDVKPENLMLTKDGAVKVVDFGLSKLIDSAQDGHEAVTKAGQIMGTPQYMSPEQFESANVDARTDIYSLGGTLCYLLTAQFPYADCRTILQMMTAHMTKPPPAPSTLDPSIPAECDRIVARAMAKELADRYQTAEELADDLEALIAGTTQRTPASGLLEIEDRPLAHLLMVEPSRLQGSVLKNGFSNAGVATVDIVGNKVSATEAFMRQTPDLLITAMQLPDGRGIDLLSELSRQARLDKTTAVLNSSDSTIDDLIAVGPAACLVLAPKKAKPDEILRVVHAAGPCVLASGLGATPIDPLSLRLQIVTDFDRLPESLADLLRELNLLDIGVSNALSAEAATAHLILLVRREDPMSGSADFAAQAQRAAESGPIAAAIQVEGGKLLLRAVSRAGVTAVCHRSLNIRRLSCLLQCG